MRVLLVNMPWASPDVPSLALGILKRSLAMRAPGVEVEVRYANLDFVDWLDGQLDFTGRDYGYYSHSSYFEGCGDWVFSSALYGEQWRVREFTERMSSRISEEMLDLCLRLHALTPRFVAWLAERIVETAPDVVGFTSTFQQNVAALAAAREVKRLAPGTRVVFGGANCDGAQGEALHRNFPFVDYVIRGEAETSFPLLLTSLTDGGDALTAVPGLCRRAADGTVTVNAMSTRPLPPAEITMPDYDGYFERFTASRAGTWTEPKLVLEGSRGCWWGAKHHCTFCGLNGSFMQFRSKNPAVFYEEIMDSVRRHRVLDIFVVDNILDMGYLTSLLPRMAEAGYDLRLHYEIKSNMRRDQLQVLADAGLVHVQPGIESLNGRVLSLMDKGVTGCLNVRMLRDAASIGLSVEWNYLYGFPSEATDDYDKVIEQVPALHHLMPAHSVGRIVIERFSPYFDRPELGFADLRPDPQYSLTYDLPEAELMDFAYLFDAPPRGIGDDIAERLDAAIGEWRRSYPSSRLSHCDLGDQIVLVSHRPAFDWTVRCLTDPLDLAAFRLLDQPHTLRSLTGKIAATHGPIPESTVSALLSEWRALGLVFTDGGQYVHVAPAATNQELVRVMDPHHLAEVPAPV